MSITGVNSYYSTLSLASLYETQDATSVSDDSTLSASISSSSSSQSDSLDLSQPAEIYSKLQELAKSDPAKLKEVCADIAKKLKSASESDSGKDSKMLSDLAEKFQNVADGGDVSQLKPPDPPSFGDGSQGAIGSYTQNDSQKLSLMSSSQSISSNGNQLLSSILEEINKAIDS